MALKPRKQEGTGTTQPLIVAGTYPIRVAQIIDLGVQKQRPYQGKEKPPVQEVMLTYEFLDEFCVDEDGNEDEAKPRWLSETMPLYSLKADKAKSTNRYLAIDPQLEFDEDFTMLAGGAANATIVHNAGKGANVGKTYMNIQSLSAMRPKDVANAPDLKNPTKVFVLDEPDLEVFSSLPEWIQDKIKGNLEYQGSVLQKALEGPQSGSDEPQSGDDLNDDEGW